MRFPSLAVAELYAYRRLGELAARLDELDTPPERSAAASTARTARGALQLGGVGTLLATELPGWIVMLLAFDDLTGARGLPRLGWGWLVLAWLVLLSTPAAS